MDLLHEGLHLRRIPHVRTHDAHGGADRQRPELLGERLFGAERTHVALLTTEPGASGALDPNRTLLTSALRAIADSASATDVVVVYLAGHGVVHGGAAYFEPIHGSAPSIAGKDRANPLSMVLSGAMMLDWLGETGAARRVRDAVDAALGDKRIAIEPDGTVTRGTRAAAQAVVDRVRG